MNFAIYHVNGTKKNPIVFLIVVKYYITVRVCKHCVLSQVSHICKHRKH